MVLTSHQCLQCDYKSSQQGTLQRHIKLVHEGKKFQCPQCEHKATQKGNLWSHIKSVHEGSNKKTTEPRKIEEDK